MRNLWMLVLMLVSMVSAGCDLIGDIFQAGMAVGVIVVVLVIGAIGFVISRLRR